MRKILAAAAILTFWVAPASAAQAPAAAPAETEEDKEIVVSGDRPDPRERLICRRETTAGSRIPSRRARCATRSQLAEQARNSRDSIAEGREQGDALDAWRAAQE